MSGVRTIAFVFFGIALGACASNNATVNGTGNTTTQHVDQPTTVSPTTAVSLPAGQSTATTSAADGGR